jgi:probable DNA metabolism protein
MHVRLNSETDFAGFRAQARALLARGMAPDQVEWLTPGSAGLFEDEPSEPDAAAAAASHVPPAFLDLCRTVILHRDPQRFALLYRLLWRLVHEPALRHDPLDADMLQARRMAQAVRRDIHKMHAFVRFRPVAEEGVLPGDALHVAWFEPDHHIVEHNADWFRRRFTNMRWAILSPECCIAWDRKTLTVRPGTGRENAPPADAGEQLWLTYYRHIFNPARLKMKMMQKEMPRKYWHNLPEAALIGELAAQAAPRSLAMIENEATVPRRRIPLKPAAEPADSNDEPRSGARSMRALRAAVQQCLECPIGALATHGVCGEGNEKQPALMLVGEQPGDREDLEGRPFVGPAGHLLDRALAEAGIDRGQVFLSNAVRHFKFELRGKRRIHKSPTQREMAACHHWLEEEMALIQPHALVALGATAAKSLLGRHVAVMSERGRWWPRADGLQVFVTVHPSALLRLRDEDRDAAIAAFVQDLRQAAAGPRA